MKIRNILMVGALLLTACGNDDDVIVDEKVTGPTEASVMSFNVLYDDPEAMANDPHSWRSRRSAVLTMIDQEKPDVMCLQESAWNQVYYMADKLTAYDYVDQNVDGNDNASGLHNTIFFKKDKYTLVDNGHFWLSSQPRGLSYPWNTTDRNRRVAVWAHLKDNQTKAHFYVCSTQMNEGDGDVDIDARKRSSELIADMLGFKNSQDTTMIVCGDLNMSHAISDPSREGMAPLYEWMESARETAAQTDSKYSYNQFEPQIATERWNLDHIFVRKGTALTFRTLDGDYGVPFISDHYPIVSTIKF